MKCDELKARTAYSIAMEEEDLESSGTTLVYLKSDVDSAFAELKAKLESVQASMYCDVVDANMENRRLRRALWLARAMRAQESQYWGAYVRYVHSHEKSFYEFFDDDVFRRDNPNNDSYRIWYHIWQSVERKCLAKAEEYK